MMEKVTFKEYKEPARDISWCTRGKPVNGERRVITSLHIQPEAMEAVNHKLQAKYREIKRNEVRYELQDCDDADVVIVGFGLSARIGLKTKEMLRQKGKKVGLMKPISLWPFPEKAIADLAKHVKAFYVIELNAGQMIEDVRLANEGRAKVGQYNRFGGMIYSPDEVAENLEKFCKELGL
jgi:2-oxoglutarate ferredoxin oxidoreductase subunit alpha